MPNPKARIPPNEPNAPRTVQEAAIVLNVPVRAICKWRDLRKIIPVGYLSAKCALFGMRTLRHLAEQYHARKSQT